MTSSIAPLVYIIPIMPSLIVHPAHVIRICSSSFPPYSSVDPRPAATRTMTSNRRAIHFGAGNIGRGFIGPLLVQSGYHVVFADIDKKLIDNINHYGEYNVHVLDPSKPRPVSISDISGVISTSDDILAAIADPRVDIITTSVGVGVLPRIARTVARGISERRKAVCGPMNIIACENAVGATATLAKSVDEYLSEEDKEYTKENVGFANCAVDRIVPPFKNDTPLDVGVEEFSGVSAVAVAVISSLSFVWDYVD